MRHDADRAPAPESARQRWVTRGLTRAARQEAASAGSVREAIRTRWRSSGLGRRRSSGLGRRRSSGLGRRRAAWLGRRRAPGFLEAHPCNSINTAVSARHASPRHAAHGTPVAITTHQAAVLPAPAAGCSARTPSPPHTPSRRHQPLVTWHVSLVWVIVWGENTATTDGPPAVVKLPLLVSALKKPLLVKNTLD